MSKFKVVTILGTRPEIIRLSQTIKKLDQYFEHTLVHTGQNYDYELNQVFFDELDLRKPDYYLETAGNSLGDTLGNIISKSYAVLAEIKPDAVLVLGDTNSCLAVIAAKRLHVPIFHMEAGNRCFDENVPEESNRRLIDHISDINLPYSERSFQNLIVEGFPSDRMYVIGSPIPEVLQTYAQAIADSKVLQQLDLQPKKYFVVSAHREENVDSPGTLRLLVESLNQLAEKYQFPLLFSTHPRTKQRIEGQHLQLHRLIQSHKPLGLFDYCQLENQAFCVLSDSGTLAVETGYFKFPSVSLRTSTERPEAVSKSALVLAGNTPDTVINAVELVVKQHENGFVPEAPVDYRDLDVSNRVVQIIQSFIPYVRKNVYHLGN
jgi:UDP-N-acetylglucosamine 2-epimerase (non-hydrolysing)